MKITLRERAKSEPEVIIIYPEMDDGIKSLIKKIRDMDAAFSVKDGDEQILLHINDIYYIETVERKTFVYTRDGVYRTGKKYSTLCDELEKYDFVPVSRSCILNVNVLESIKTIHNSRLEGTLCNGEKINISRTYMKGIRKIFDRGESE